MVLRQNKLNIRNSKLLKCIASTKPTSEKLIDIRLCLEQGADVNTTDNNSRTPLHLAVVSSCKSVAVVKLLLKRGANINAVNIYGNTPLHDAVRHKEMSIVEFLVKNGADINKHSLKYEHTALHEAARSGVISIVELLLDNDADLNAKDEDGHKPVHWAAKSGRTSIVELLLNKGADVDEPATNGYTPLHAAAHSGTISTVQLLLNKGANINVLTKNGYTVLHAAAGSKSISMVELILNKCVDVNAQTTQGDTALHEAISSGVAIVNMLLKKGADVNTSRSNGLTALHIAMYETTPTAELLLNCGANLHAQDESGYTPLHIAAQFKNTPVIELLLSKGANVNKATSDGYTPLLLAVRAGSIYIVEYLLNKGADVNAKSSDGHTALYLAVRHGKTDIVKLLLNKGANVKAQTLDGQTALHMVAYTTEYNIIILLLNHGADINAQDLNGDTPLHEAVRVGISTPIVKLLLDKGADVNAQNLNGDTPLHEALYRENDLIPVLLNHNADVTLRNKSGDTPLSYTLLHCFRDNKNTVSLLHTAEQKLGRNFLAGHSSQKTNPCDIFKRYGESLISNITNVNNSMQFNYLKTNDNCGMLGQLYETKLLSLIFIKVLNHRQIDHDIFLGSNIDGIGAFDDICLRYQVVGKHIPVVLFMQAKHKEDSGNEKITEKDLWNNSGNFSLPKYFKSYLIIRERFQVGNEDPMFEGKYNDIDCYFILYTSGNENIMKKNVKEVDATLHSLINTGKSILPFQYNYNEIDIDRLVQVAAETQSNSAEYVIKQVKDFFSRLWFYTGQAKEHDVEDIVKIEINHNYNDNKKKANKHMFEFHSNAIFLQVHDKIRKWWKQRNKRENMYLKRSDDFFRLAKVACLDDVLLLIFNAMHHLKISVDFTFSQCTTQHDIGIETHKTFNTILSRLSKVSKNTFINVDNNLKNKVVKLITEKEFMNENTPSSNSTSLTQDQSMFVGNDTQTVISNNNLLFKHTKRVGTSEDGGVLFKTKMLCLVISRVLNYEQQFLVGTKISGIKVMNDICLRYQAEGQPRPTVLFVQLIHREDPENRQLTEEAIWSDFEDFNLLKFLKSYLVIRDRFQISNNPMFGGQFCNTDCYFIVFTPAQESLTKKKTGNRASQVIQDIFNTEKSSEPFQYDYDEIDIDRLTKALVVDQIEEMGTVLLQSIIRGKHKTMLTNKLILKYHMVIGREVLQPCVDQPAIAEYRLWQFRPEFFDSDLDYLVVLKKTFAKILLPKRYGQNKISNDYEPRIINDDIRKELERRDLLNRIKLTLAFGNLDMNFRIEKRIKAVADDLMYFIKMNKDTTIITINDYDVGPGKTINQGFIDINGGIGGAIGNLFCLDRDSNMLKIDTENEKLPRNAALLLKELKDDRHNFNGNLSSFRFRFYLSVFPKYSFREDESDKILTREFLSKFWFSAGQEKENKLDYILKDEINKKYIYNKVFSNIIDIISLQSIDVIQKWWLQPTESPYLSRASELFERIELAEMYNLLQTVINYMYITDIGSVDISVNRASENEKLEQMHQVFQSLSCKLFNLLDPEFNKPFYLRPPANREVNERITSKICLRIHPEMEWVSLTMTTEYTNLSYSIIAKVSLRSECPAQDGFALNEISSNGLYAFSRDCFEDNRTEEPDDLIYWGPRFITKNGENGYKVFRIS